MLDALPAGLMEAGVPVQTSGLVQNPAPGGVTVAEDQVVAADLTQIKNRQIFMHKNHYNLQLLN